MLNMVLTINSVLASVIVFLVIANISDYYPFLVYGQPSIEDNNTGLILELVASGLKYPTGLAFLGPDDLLVIEKDEGTVRRIVNGQILEDALLDIEVANEVERGLLGISVLKDTRYDGNKTFVYLYYTEAETDGGEAIGNRLYRYELVDNELKNPELMLDLPVEPGPAHNGGVIAVGPDNNVYVVVGNLFSNLINEGSETSSIQNVRDGSPPDGRGGILRITPDDSVVEGKGILGDEHPLNFYYAYGIRNSFGIAFDPITGKLWDTENGPGFGDEINLVEPGFNSGWNRVQGISEYQLETEEKLREVGRNYYGGPVAPEQPDDLVDFGGKGKYSTPEFIWKHTVGVTAIKFLDSDKLGKEYQNDIFVGDIHNGNLYHFDLNEDRNQLLLDGPLKDRIANNQDKLQQAILGRGFDGITDIEVGPDRYLYILSYAGSIFRISSQG